MKYYFHAEDDEQNPVAEFSAPTIEMLEEKIGAFERSQEKNALSEPGSAQCLHYQESEAGNQD